MANRVTDNEVKAIMDVDTAISSLTPFIDAANSLVTELCAGSGYSADRLKQIELWLAAHFVAIRDPRTQSEGVAGISASYQGQTGMGLSGTTYGQQAMMLDTAGKLVQLNKAQAKGGKISMTWLGTPRSTVG